MSRTRARGPVRQPFARLPAGDDLPGSIGALEHKLAEELLNPVRDLCGTVRSGGYGLEFHAARLTTVVAGGADVTAVGVDQR